LFYLKSFSGVVFTVLQGVMPLPMLRGGKYESTTLFLFHFLLL
jgi:hypothetical protein